MWKGAKMSKQPRDAHAHLTLFDIVRSQFHHLCHGQRMQNTGESVGTKISTKAVSMATFNLHLQRAMRNAP